MDKVTNHLNFNLRHHDKCKVALEIIPLVTTSDLISLQILQKSIASIANCVYYWKTRLLNVNANERKLHSVIYAWLFTWNEGICDEMGSSFNRMYRSTRHWFLLLLKLSGYLSGQQGYDNSPDR